MQPDRLKLAAACNHKLHAAGSGNQTFLKQVCFQYSYYSARPGALQKQLEQRAAFSDAAGGAKAEQYDCIGKSAGKARTQYNAGKHPLHPAQPGTNRTYQVRWSEDEYSVSGSATGKKDFYVALFTVTVNPPSKEQELLINPLGLKIADLNYSRENQEG